MMRITWKPVERGFVAATTPKPEALKGWAPIRLIRRSVESDGFAIGTWQLTGPVRTNLWVGVSPVGAKQAAAKMIRAYCAALG